MFHIGIVETVGLQRWGMNGVILKLAMYPYNRKSQFTKIVELMTPQGPTY